MDDLRFDVLEPEPIGGSLSEDIENLLNFDAPLTPAPAAAADVAAELTPPPRDDSPPPGASDEQTENVAALVAPYCDVQTLFSLSCVSRDVRRAATQDRIWRPICGALGVADRSSDSNDLISLASAFNVLDLGYTIGDNAAYATFCRAYVLLRPIIAEAKQCVSPEGRQAPLSHVDKALLLTGAMRLAQVLAESDDVSGDELASLNKVVAEEREDLADALMQATERQEPVGPIFMAYDVWWKRLGLEDMREEALDIYFSKNSAEWDAEEAFSFDNDTGSKTVSARKLSMFFHDLAAQFSASRRSLSDARSEIPAEWHDAMQSVFFDRFTRQVGDYVSEVLQLAQKISETEYLSSVPKVFTASRTLLESDFLRSSDAWGENRLRELLSAHILENMVEDFCTRQSTFFEEDASAKVSAWMSSVSERESETERFIWSSVPRKRDKTNFVTAFKWAVSSLNSRDDQLDADANLEMGATEALSTPQTEFEAQTAVLVSKFKGMEKLVSLELVINLLESCRAAFHRFKTVEREDAKIFEPMFVTLVNLVGQRHIKHAFEKAIKVLNAYDPKRFGRLVISLEEKSDGDADDQKRGGVVEPLVMFTELVNVGDLVQQMLHVFFEEELVATHLVRKTNFGSPSVTAKRKFEQMLDDMLAEGLSRGIDVLMDQVEFTLVTEQLGSDFLPVPTQEIRVGPTVAAKKVIDLVKSHLDLLRDSTEKSLFDVFLQEVGIRLYTAITKHIKRQKISIDGAVMLISDINAYYAFVLTLKQKSLYPYYEALKQVGQLYLIDTKDAKQLGLAVSDVGRYNGVIFTDELVEFLKRRQDWPLVKGRVERVLYGVFECIIC